MRSLADGGLMRLFLGENEIRELFREGDIPQTSGWKLVGWRQLLGFLPKDDQVIEGTCIDVTDETPS